MPTFREIMTAMAGITILGIAVIAPPYLSGSMAFQLRDDGNRALHEGDLRTALQKHRRAVEINSADPDYRADLARTHLALDRPEDAITQYTLALETDPEHSASLVGRAEALRHMGMEESARRDIGAARRLGIETEKGR